MSKSPSDAEPEPPLAVLPRAVLDQLATTNRLLRGRAMLRTHRTAAQAVPQSPNPDQLERERGD